MPPLTFAPALASTTLTPKMRRTLPLAALLATAATTATAPAAAGAADELTRYAEARERWAVQDARDYSFRLRLQCFCPLREPVKIRV